MSETPKGSTRLEQLRSFDALMGKLDEILERGDTTGMAVILVHDNDEITNNASLMLHGLSPAEFLDLILKLSERLMDALQKADQQTEGQA